MSPKYINKEKTLTFLHGVDEKISGRNTIRGIFCFLFFIIMVINLFNSFLIAFLFFIPFIFTVVKSDKVETIEKRILTAQNYYDAHDWYYEKERREKAKLPKKRERPWYSK